MIATIVVAALYAGSAAWHHQTTTHRPETCLPYVSPALSQEVFAPGAAGLVVGDSLPTEVADCLAQARVIFLSRGTGMADQLVRRIITASVKAESVAVICVDRASGTDGFKSIGGEELAAALHTAVYPSVYVVSDAGIVLFRCVGFTIEKWRYLESGLRGMPHPYDESTLMEGTRLPAIHLPTTDGSDLKHQIAETGRRQVILVVDVNCDVCKGAADWFFGAPQKFRDANFGLIVIDAARNAHREWQAAIEQYDAKELLEGLQPPGPSKRAAQYMAKSSELQWVAVDGDNNLVTHWSIYQVPTVLVLDSDGVLIDRMLVACVDSYNPAGDYLSLDEAIGTALATLGGQ